MLDEQTGELKSGFMAGGPTRQPRSVNSVAYGSDSGNSTARDTYADHGGASRFYYVAKPSRRERDRGCADLDAATGGAATDRKDGSKGLGNPRAGVRPRRDAARANIHPTVKPVELMRWLVRLVTPIDGTVLDPFCGSGTTGMACRFEGRTFIGIEREKQYVEIARRRISSVRDRSQRTA